jgi:predicted glycogen debranching enzyme
MTDDRTEWLEADGLGGFASGTTSGIRTRRYHALLLTATTPPTGRIVLVNGFDAWVTTPAGRFALSTQRYQPGVLHPDGYTRIVSFSSEPWPTWEFETPDGVRITQEIFVPHGAAASVLSWRLHTCLVDVDFEVRPFLSGRDYHATHHENRAFRFEPKWRDGAMEFEPYDGVPIVHIANNGAYTHKPAWYRNFLYTEERERGLDDTEDLASPGIFTWALDEMNNEAVLIFRATADVRAHDDALQVAERLRAAERTRRAAFPSVLERAGDAYLVKRGSGQTIVAGYPWFTDWGRDTFISVRGLCIATGRLVDAREILIEWAGAVSQGMLPNRFCDAGESPEYNAVDASLWYVIAVHDLLAAAGDSREVVSDAHRARLHSAVDQILEGYARGTRYGIALDKDGLLAAGQRGVQLTWMDAKVGEHIVTPRIGKPVEIQALWINALWIASQRDSRWVVMLARAKAAFADRFWNADRACLYDVVDVDHVQGALDPALRPNQIFAVGGLPLALIIGTRARSVVDAVERELLTPVGLRSLAPSESGYARCYTGSPQARDECYHQGTVWPWLLGPFVDAWIRVRGDTDEVRRTARERFVAPMLDRAEREGSGHVFEIADAEPPFAPRGCPFQAWSLAELIRIDRATSGPSSPSRRARINRDDRLTSRAQ